MRRRGLARLSRLLLAVALVAVVLPACMGDDADETGPAPGTATRASVPAATATAVETIPTPMPLVDVTATAAASGCPMTPYTAVWVADDGAQVPRYEVDGLSVEPEPAWAGRWYAGSMLVLWASDAAGELLVEASRRDAAAEPVAFSDTIAANDVLVSELLFPDAGCWDVTATLGTRELAFTVNVLPFLERDDVQEELAVYSARIPYPPPAECATTPLAGPKYRRATGASTQLAYSVEGDGLRVDGELDALFAGENALRWYPEEWGEITVDGSDAAGSGAVGFAGYIRSADRYGEHWATTLLFPGPGCWQLHGAVGDQAVDLTVYVYPAECRAELGHTPPADCPRPG
jgi:hypothetical protein